MPTLQKPLALYVWETLQRWLTEPALEVLESTESGVEVRRYTLTQLAEKAGGAPEALQKLEVLEKLLRLTLSEPVAILSRRTEAFSRSAQLVAGAPLRYAHTEGETEEAALLEIAARAPHGEWENLYNAIREAQNKAVKQTVKALGVSLNGKKGRR